MDIARIEKSVKLSRWIVSSIFLVTLGSYAGWFFLYQGQTLSGESGVWGAFGDFVGGLLNPLIAYSAFYWLTVSVVVQKQELAETKSALIDSSNAQQRQVNLQKEHLYSQREKNTIQKAAMIVQKEQVIASQQALGIEIIKMRIDSLSIQLESAYSFRDSVALNALAEGQTAQTMNRDGRVVPSDGEIFTINKKIAEMEVKRNNFILEASNLLIGNKEVLAKPN